MREWRRIPFTPRRVRPRTSGPVISERLVYKPSSAVARAGLALGLRIPEPLRPLEAVPLSGAIWRRVLDVARPFTGDVETANVIDSSRRGRVVARLDGTGSSVFVKVGVEDPGLRQEADTLERLQQSDLVPRLLWAGPLDEAFAVVTSVLHVQKRRPSHRAAAEIARRVADHDVRHGDLTPWNMIADQRGWRVVDWEQSASGRDPYADYIHYVLRAGAHLSTYTPATAVELLLDTHEARDLWRLSTLTSRTDAAETLRRHVVNLEATATRRRRAWFSRVREELGPQ